MSMPLPFFLKGVALILSTGQLIFLTNTISSDLFGLYILNISIMVVLNILISTGLSKYLLRDLARNYSRKKTFEIKGVIMRCSFLVLAFSLGVSLIARNQSVSLLLFCLVPCVFSSLCSSYLRAKGNLIVGNLEGTIFRPIVVTTFFWLSIFLEEPLTIELMMLLLGCTLWLAAIGLYFYASFSLKSYSVRSYIKNIPNAKSIIMLTIVGGFEFLLVNSESAVLGFVSDPKELAIFKICLIFKTLFMMPLIAANMFLPYLISSRDASQIQLTQSLAYFGTGLGIVILGLNLLVGEEIIGIVFGADYIPASGLINWFFITLVAISFLGSHPEKLIANYRENVFFAFGVSILVLDLLIIYYLGSHFGASVAVISSSVSTCLVCIFSAYFNRPTKRLLNDCE